MSRKRKNDPYRTGRHCVFVMHVHLVFVTKYRYDVLTAEHINYMQEVFLNICKQKECQLIEFNGEEDHVHLLINYPPKIQISKLVNSLKGVSSRRLREKYPELQDKYYQGVLWSPSYFASSCGGAPLNIIREYIENQQRPF